MEEKSVSTRIVKVYSSQLGEREVKTSAQTWGQLKNELDDKGIKHSGMKSVVGETKATLESSGADIPKGDFTLFLMPKKTKAGGKYDDMSYKDLRKTIQNIIAKNPDAKDHFNKGKNYTTKKTEELRKLLKSFKGDTTSVAEVAEAKPPKKDKKKDKKKSKDKKASKKGKKKDKKKKKKSSKSKLEKQYQELRGEFSDVK